MYVLKLGPYGTKAKDKNGCNYIISHIEYFDGVLVSKVRLFIYNAKSQILFLIRHHKLGQHIPSGIKLSICRYEFYVYLIFHFKMVIIE